MPRGFDIFLQEIIERVNKDRSYETDWAMLLNTAFRPEEGKPSPEAHLRAWAEANNLCYKIEPVYGKKKEYKVLFWPRKT